MSRQLPKNASDFLAIAELITNPEAVAKLKEKIEESALLLKEQCDRADSISDELKTNGELLDTIRNENAERQKLIATMQLDFAKLAIATNDLAVMQGALADREAAIETREQLHESHADALGKQEEELAESLEEHALNQEKLADALQQATDEYIKWERKNAKIIAIVEKG